jgi:hypothetical protein
MADPRSLARSVLAWPVESQQRARRNALVASTALAQLRRERADVEEFLEALDRRRLPAAAPVTVVERISLPG